MIAIRHILILGVCLMAFCGTLPARGQLEDFATPQKKEVVQVKTYVTSNGKVRPGDDAVIAVVLDIDPPFHINPAGEPPEPNLIPTTLSVLEAPSGLTLGTSQFPEAQSVEVRFGGTPRNIQALAGHVKIYVPVKVSPDITLGEHRVKLKLNYQACNETNCLFPVKQEISVAIDVAREASTASADEVEIFRGFHQATGAQPQEVKLDFFGWEVRVSASTGWGFAALLGLAGLGGLLLNFTPCVLPVIPIKIMGLSKAAESRSRTLLLGAVMSFGVVLFWLVLAGIVAGTSKAIEQWGTKPTWGLSSSNELFQHPWFTITIGLIITLMSIGMCGLFSIRLPQFVYLITPKRESLTGSLLFGVMTAILSTPCTAPFMGGAAAWSIKQPPSVVLLIFATIGVGMALPYMILSAFPSLVDRMPRTGPASELIKQIMGLLMLAAGVYFVGSGISGLLASPVDPPSRLFWWAVGIVVAAAGLWLAYRTVCLSRRPIFRAVFVSLGLVMCAAGLVGAKRLADQGPINWIYYTPERLAQAQAEGNAVLLDFTAEWCANCKFLEHTVLYRDEVVAALQQPGIVPMKVDLTAPNRAGNEKLNAVGRVMIPALVVVTPDGREILNSDAYTVDQVLEAIKKARRQ